MGKWTRRILVTLAVLVVAGGAAYWWLVLESGTPSSAYAIDMAEIRRLADSMPGDKAREIHVENVTGFSFPATAVVAGDGWDNTPMPVFSYQLVFPQSTAIIDTALDKHAKGMADRLVFFDDAAYARMSKALHSASLIIVTHEHGDHIGGLLAQPDLQKLLSVAKLNKEQVDNLKNSVPDYPSAAFKGYAPISYEKYLAVAPGVVLIRAPGHTPGSQLVYVKTQDGNEFLFLGDVAWHMRNIDIVRERARLITLLIGEDRDAVLSELAALNALEKSEPKLQIVPGHNAEPVKALEDAGLLKKDFQ